MNHRPGAVSVTVTHWSRSPTIFLPTHSTTTTTALLTTVVLFIYSSHKKRKEREAVVEKHYYNKQTNKKQIDREPEIEEEKRTFISLHYTI